MTDNSSSHLDLTQDQTSNSTPQKVSSSSCSPLELARLVVTLTQRVNRLEEQLETLSKNTLQTAEHVYSLVENHQEFLRREQCLLQNLERLSGAAERLAQQQIKQTKQQASTNAALERQERVLDYLLRQKPDRSPESIDK
jgi:hypothetical protein